jgi:hypothetical protein
MQARADDAQVVILRDALTAPRVQTTAPATVFELGNPRQMRSDAGAPDPRTLRVVEVPAPQRRNPPSAWSAVFDAMPLDGRAIMLTRAQAVALCAWGRQHGHKLRRRPISGDEYAVWRGA